MKTTKTKTRWFQIQLRSILALFFLAALCLVLYQWIDAPRQTVAQLYKFVDTGQFEDADDMVVCDDGFVISPTHIKHRVRVVRSVLLFNSQPSRRSLSDLFYRRQTHQIVGNSACLVDTGDLLAHWLIDSVTIQGSTIRIHWRGPLDRNVRFVDGKWKRDSHEWFWNGDFAR